MLPKEIIESSTGGCARKEASILLIKVWDDLPILPFRWALQHSKSTKCIYHVRFAQRLAMSATTLVLLLRDAQAILHSFEALQHF